MKPGLEEHLLSKLEVEVPFWVHNLGKYLLDDLGLCKTQNSSLQQ